MVAVIVGGKNANDSILFSSIFSKIEVTFLNGVCVSFYFVDIFFFKLESTLRVDVKSQGRDVSSL
jgi:hypothetical protein